MAGSSSSDRDPSVNESPSGGYSPNETLVGQDSDSDSDSSTTSSDSCGDTADAASSDSCGDTAEAGDVTRKNRKDIHEEDVYDDNQDINVDVTSHVQRQAW